MVLSEGLEHDVLRANRELEQDSPEWIGPGPVKDERRPGRNTMTEKRGAKPQQMQVLQPEYRVVN